MCYKHQETTPAKVLNFIEAFQRKEKYLQFNLKSIQTLIVRFGHLCSHRRFGEKKNIFKVLMDIYAIRNEIKWALCYSFARQLENLFLCKALTVSNLTVI